MSGAATDLYDAASGLLDFCTVVLDELPAKAPARRLVTIGYPAIDCETLAVWIFPVIPGPFAPQTAPGDPFRQGHPYPVLDLVTFQIQVWRCWPTTDGKAIPKPPPALAVDAASAVLYADAWQIWNAFRAGLNLGLLGGPCKLARVDQIQAIQPDGGFAGMAILATVQLDGFTPELPDPLPDDELEP